MISLSKSRFFSFLVFVFSISISIITIIPALFPALYTSTFNKSVLDKVIFLDKFQVSSTEPGIFFVPIIVTSVVVFGIFGVLKFKSIRLPSLNVSKKVSIISMIGLLVIFTGLSYQGVISEDQHQDWILVKQGLDSWPPEEINFQLHVRYFLLSSSFVLFGNYRVIPFLASAALLITTYLFTYKITNNRASGLLSSVIILQSHLFLTYASTPSYTIFWSLFYLVSIYLIIHKTWILSPASYVLSLFSKPLTATFFPLSIFFIINANIPIKNKIIISIITLTIIGIGANTLSGSGFEGIDLMRFWIGFTSFSYQMRFDAIIIIFLIPVIVGLFFIAKNNRYANSVSIMISGILLTNPILLGITTYTSQPYRFIPLIIFFAIGAGMLISNNQSKSNQSKSNQSKSNQSKSNQSKSNQSKSNQSKSNQSKSKKTKLFSRKSK
jgi:hypothetical protein